MITAFVFCWVLYIGPVAFLSGVLIYLVGYDFGGSFFFFSLA